MANSSSILTRWVIILPILLLLLVAISTTGYCIIEEVSIAEGLFITVINISTVGSREIPGMGATGQWWTIGVIVLGFSLVAATFSVSVAALTEGTLHKVFGRRHVQRAIQNLSGHTIVCGFGRMGAMVARSLCDDGRDVVAIDEDEDVFERLDRTGILPVSGDAREEAALLAAGAKHATYLVACLPTDADNVFLTLTARQMSPSLIIIARAEHPSTENKLLHAGANRVVCPQIIGATRIANVIIRPAVVDFVEMANKGVDLEMDQLAVTAGSELANRTLRDLALPGRTGAMVVAVHRADGETIYNPGPDLLISAGDTLILVGQGGCAEVVQKLQSEVAPASDESIGE